MRSLPADSQFQAQIARIMFITGKSTQCQLAEFLGVTQASISEAAKRRQIPPRWLVTLVQKLRLNPDWILEAEAPVFLGRGEERPLAHIPLGELMEELRRRGENAQNCVCHV